MEPAKTKYHSWKMGSLPKGCRQCVQGKKTVLFITGICPRHCDYCPISDAKSGKDVVYANEWKTDKINELFEEVKLCGSEGAGITGGDPLCRLPRTVDYIKKLKKRFGKKFHIHLYTSMDLVTKNNMKQLYEAGLDEIRFHLDIDDDTLWGRMFFAKEFDWNVGVEIPVIPGKEKKTKELIDFIEGKVSFLNMNELELADTNASKLSELGFMSKDGISYGVKGAETLAKKLLKHCKSKRLNVHYCTAKLKDKVQLTKRIKRRAKNIAKEYDDITKEGMLIRGAVYTKQIYPSEGYSARLAKISVFNRLKIMKRLKVFRTALMRKHRIPAELIGIDEPRLRLLTTGAVIEELLDEIKKQGFQPAVVEEYPTQDALIVDLELL
ncbi:radical SAM protein [Thermoproteota archaeon]